MELKWLDDYLALIETGSFSAAAEKRHVSQPAFSRRIQMLESWLGASLIDRSRKPLRFTPLAEQHEAAFRNLATHIYEFQSTLRSDATQSPGMVLAAHRALLDEHQRWQRWLASRETYLPPGTVDETALYASNLIDGMQRADP